MKKKILIVLGVLVVVGAGAWYFLIFTKPSEEEIPEVTKETKVASVFEAINTEERYGAFKEFLGTTDLSTKAVAASESAPKPLMMIFAPSEASFDKDDMAPLANVPAELKEELKLYHAAVLLPSADGTKPSLVLTDGQKIATLAGREIHVKKNGGRFMLTDVKGRSAYVSGSYTEDDSGNRIYTIDAVLLLQ